MRSKKPRCCCVLAGLCENMAVFLLKTNLSVKSTEPRVKDFLNERRNHRSVTKLWLLHGEYLNFSILRCCRQPCELARVEGCFVLNIISVAYEAIISVLCFGSEYSLEHKQVRFLSA